MTVRRPSFPPFLLLSFHLLAALHTTSDAAVSSHMPAIQCSPSGKYTSANAYAANLNQFLASLPEKTVSKNGGFFNGTVGEGKDTVYGLAMCSAEYPRSDCGDCLAAAANNSASGLLNRCPGSTTVVAWFDQCLVRYSDTNFFATAESGIIYAWQCPPTVRKTVQYSDAWANNLRVSVYAAMASPQRFGTSSTDPYMLVQCTWDLPPNLCMQCVQELSANSSLSSVELPVEGKLGSYSCALRYSKTSFPVVPFVGGPTPQYVDQAARSATQSSGASKGAPMPQPQSVDQAARSATQSSGASKGAPMPQSVDQAARSATQSSGVGKGSLAVGVVESVVGLILLACLAALIWHVVKRRSKSKTGHVREFTYGELATATLDFADSRKLGQGAFGVVYRGAVMMQGKEVDVAIKDNINGVSDETRKAFKNEVEIMSPLNHRNIIRLVGWCKTRNKLLLVYELVQNRNLEARLYDHGGTDLVLDWRQRYNILVGIASGLEYLHNNCSKTVMHRDIKPANVMLDMDFNAKLCDFGLVTQLTRAATSRSTNNIIGTQGYMDPLFQQNGQVTPSSDVYSFGVLLLEVVCGVAPILIGHPPENSLIKMVRECADRNAILDAAHQRLRGGYDEEIKGALLIGLHCAQARRVDRPTTRIVLSNLVSLAASHVVP